MQQVWYCNKYSATNLLNMKKFEYDYTRKKYKPNLSEFLIFMPLND